MGESSCSIFEKNKTYIVHEGEICVIPSNRPHAITQQKPYTNLVALSILFSDNYLKRCIDDYEQLNISFSPLNSITMVQKEKLKEINQRFNQLLLTFESTSKKNNRLKQTILVNQILYLLVTYFSVKSNSIEEFKELPIEVGFINNYIEKNFSQSSLIQKLSVEMNLAPAYVSRMYKKESGRTLTNQINETRLYESYRLITEQKYNINYISDVCGFSTTSYFIGKFKKKYGITPKKMEQLIKKNQKSYE